MYMGKGRSARGAYHALRWPFGRRPWSTTAAATWQRDAVREVARFRPSPPGWTRARREVDETAVYRDLEDVTDADSATLIACRGLAIRIALRADRHRDPDHEIERAAYAEYIRHWRATRHGAEAGALAKVLRVAGRGHSPALARALLTVADHAARLGHDDGAFECYRATFELAVASSAHEIGALAASALVRLSQVCGSAYATRAWRRRRRVLERRPLRERVSGKA